MWRKEERRSSLWAACFSEFNPNNGPEISGFLSFILHQTGGQQNTSRHGGRERTDHWGKKMVMHWDAASWCKHELIKIEM
jgi:hypothetical protein